MGWIRRAPLVSDDMAGWIEESFDWVEAERPDWWAAATLVTPTKAFFTAPGGEDHETARRVLDDLRRILGIEAEIALERLPDLPDELSHEYGVTSRVAGEYWHDDTHPMITYDPKLMRRPVSFINVMAHELMHARLAPVVDALPGGAEAHELATDLHCIIAGFGLFQLNAADQDGWAGYMSQNARAWALAEFVERKGIAPHEALERLGSRPRKLVQRAVKEMD